MPDLKSIPIRQMIEFRERNKSVTLEIRNNVHRLQYDEMEAGDRPLNFEFCVKIKQYFLIK
jgi:hypothetical protein